MLHLTRRSARIVGVAVAGSVGTGFAARASSADPKVAFSPKEWRTFPVEKVESLSHDTKLFRLKLPSPEHEMGMTTASCILVKGRDLADTKDVFRPYTPTSTNHELGYFDLVIKKYPEGAVSSYCHKLKPGDAVAVKGPFPKISYKRNMVKSIGMIAGGTGITPMLQVLHEMLRDPEDVTQVTLIFANKTPADIMLKEHIDELAAKHRQLKVIYKVDAPAPHGWLGGVGYITAADIETLMPAPGSDGMVFVCGPDPMVNILAGPKAEDKSQGELTGMLKQLGYKEAEVYKF